MKTTKQHERGKPLASPKGLLAVVRNDVETPPGCVANVGGGARIEAIRAQRVGVPLSAARRMILTLAALGYLLNRGFLLLEERMLRWHRHANAKNWG